MDLTQAQIDYIKQQVEANPGYSFIDASPNLGGAKFTMRVITPSGQRTINQPVKNQHDWQTDDTQFHTVVGWAIETMLASG